jgi:ADP-heptose:LPS heptosyltransferase
MATGFARGAKDRGKRVAFGDGNKIIWDKNSPEIFKKNKNIAIPGSEGDADIEWVPFYRGNRIYNKQGSGRWIWNYEFRPTPGELFFSDDELRYAKSIKPGYVIIEPNLPWHKTVAPNKDWGVRKYQELATKLNQAGYKVAQFSFGRFRLHDVKTIPSASFRHAIAAMTRAGLAILPEGGLHHGAAAVGLPAVVLFGGFIPPQVTGYDLHTNLTGGAEACGSLGPCPHCKAAMAKISVDEVFEAALSKLKAEQC